MRSSAFLILVFGSLTWAQAPAPIIDMHLHALPADHQGPPPLAMCTPMQMPYWDPQEPYAQTFMDLYKNPHCDDPVWSPIDDASVLSRTLTMLEKHNVYGVLSGTRDKVDAWMIAAPGRFIPGLGFDVRDDMPTPEALAEWHGEGKLDVLAEITTQYQGIEPGDARLEPYWSALEANDIPAGIHVGPGPPGVVYLGANQYRARMHSAMTTEEVLAAHPKLRLYLMHAGFPLLDDLLAVLYAHPQVYVDVGVIVWTQPREAFYRYVNRLFDAGFGKRVMFGSDQMVWPETIERSIDVINDAPFLSDEEKRDILFWNAARFLRLSEAEIERMHNPAD